jgi:hypothetical protein
MKRNGTSDYQLVLKIVVRKSYFGGWLGLDDLKRESPGRHAREIT